MCCCRHNYIEGASLQHFCYKFRPASLNPIKKLLAKFLDSTADYELAVALLANLVNTTAS